MHPKIERRERERKNHKIKNKKHSKYRNFYIENNKIVFFNFLLDLLNENT